MPIREAWFWAQRTSKKGLYQGEPDYRHYAGAINSLRDHVKEKVKDLGGDKYAIITPYGDNFLRPDWCILATQAVPVKSDDNTVRLCPGNEEEVFRTFLKDEGKH